ncbi:hypothetical protein PISMIDRAFT_14749 [Pisolithus microcarpus 441]|uniref:Unplaced genomic scaffold scaffold_132, whole genome shotgun sequence n=1 Tax=Pisolithus microcarpus 441 TaxID=765257 RepID=A0A0C9XZN4_9AGAM|nr:hypothetical protein BKA83DRAFT_14749 [Pisolithus microcarpus]KIK17950.1 hypothetical protein PISMIDRAFT_14749 [Pisolithus microcarpus 441]
MWITNKSAYIYDEKKAEDKMVQNSRCSYSSAIHADGSLAFGVIRLVIDSAPRANVPEDIDPVRELGVRCHFKCVTASLMALCRSRINQLASTTTTTACNHWNAFDNRLRLRHVAQSQDRHLDLGCRKRDVKLFRTRYWALNAATGSSQIRVVATSA